VSFNVLRRGALRRQYDECVEAARTLAATFNPRLASRLFDAAATLDMIDRRRVEICRALVNTPRLLLLDEPSAGMTRGETRELMDDILQVRGARADLTIVIIEHEMNVIERMTGRCVVLNYGEKIAEGPFRTVASDPAVQEAYLGAAVT
jgi:branched-chain amino acid transport system ATP-binding protein/sulfate-transporting ATPase